MYMGVRGNIIEWVSNRDLTQLYEGSVLHAPANAKVGMIWDGAVASESPKTHEQIDSLRKVAYQQRSDPLYMQWQYDRTPEAEQLWRAEVAAIKQEYPFPV